MDNEINEGMDLNAARHRARKYGSVGLDLKTGSNLFFEKFGVVNYSGGRSLLAKILSHGNAVGECDSQIGFSGKNSATKIRRQAVLQKERA